MSLPFEPVSDLESRLVGDPDFLAGADFGKPRPGHPEGAVKWHIAEVLANVDRWYSESPLYSDLRLIALVHDTFKYRVDPDRQPSGDNHHGAYARRFAEKYLDDPQLLLIIELHDEAYNSWQKGFFGGNWHAAEERAQRLIDRLGDATELYLAFFRCDNATGDKKPDSLNWFSDLVSRQR